MWGRNSWSSTMRLNHLGTIILLICHLMPNVGLSQSQTRPGPDAAAYNEVLQIGPIPGLTTAWHPAPLETVIPLGRIVSFRTRLVPPVRVVDWDGLRVIELRRYRWTGECNLTKPGPHLVTIDYVDTEGELRQERSLFHVVDNVTEVSNPRIVSQQMPLDGNLTNEDTMRYFFGESIAAVRQIANQHYITSIKSWFRLEVDVEPSGLAPILEWRLDGRAQNHLGAAIEMQVFPPRLHTITVGPLEHPEELRLETYMARIIDPEKGETVVDGHPVTFTAKTRPPGYEDEVTWLASTKYGSCDPVSGKGAEFTVRFLDTFGIADSSGRGRQWLGAKADNDVFNQDRKMIPPVTLIKVADKQTKFPDANMPLEPFLSAFTFGPSLRNGEIAFEAAGTDGLRSLFEYSNGEISKIVDTQTLAPGQDSNFTHFEGPSIGRDGVVAFVGSVGEEPPSPFPHVDSAVYIFTDGELKLIVDEQTPSPSTEEIFTSFFGASHDDGTTAFIGYNSLGGQGIYTSSGEPDPATGSALELVADINTRFPSAESRCGQCPPKAFICCANGLCVNSVNLCDAWIIIIIFSSPVVSHGDIAFCGQDLSGNKGIYVFTEGRIEVVADTNTPIPGGVGNFVDFGVREGLYAGKVAFVGIGENGQEGIYTNLEDELTVVADKDTRIPQGHGNFIGFSPFNGVSLNHDTVAFTAAGADNQGGIYLSRNGVLMPVLQHGQDLDGMMIDVDAEPGEEWWLSFPPFSMDVEALDNDELTFVVQFPNGSNAIFLATVNFFDCNGNNTDDLIDVETRDSEDINLDGVPDECQFFPEG